MSHVLNDVNHFVIDDDGVFVINPATREITYTRDGEEAYYDLPVLVQGDCNSERLTFKIPKTVEGHDMSTCNLIRIHYITIDSATSSQYKDAYDVPLSDIDATSDEDYLRFTWLVDRNVTQTVGPISFAIQFACTVSSERTETSVDEETGEETTVTVTVVNNLYSLSTKPYTELSISDGINNTKQAAEDFEDKYNSIVITWHNDIEAAISRSNASNIKSIDQTTTSPDDSGINVVTVTYGDDTTSTFTVKNGSKGSVGLSAYQVALNNGFEGSEQEWLDSLKAIGYEDCLKGVTLTQAEYDCLSEAEKNREDFVYIIKSETLHADTATRATTADSATTADTATVAVGYTEGGAIDTALKSKASSVHTHHEITDHEERVKTLEDGFDAIISGPTTETGEIVIPYNIQTVYENGVQRSKVFGTEQVITTPDGWVFTSVETSFKSADHSMGQSAVTAAISDDGKTITFNLSTYTSPTTSLTGTATINYSCTREYTSHAYYASHLKLNTTTYTISKDEYTSVNISRGRAYLISITLDPTEFSGLSAMVYIPESGNAATSTPFSAYNHVCEFVYNTDDGWQMYMINVGENARLDGDVVFIEL